LAFGEDVHVEVGDGLAGIRAAVDHDPEAAVQAERSCDLGGDDEEMGEDGGVGLDHISDSLYQLLGYDKQVDGGLRIDVVDDDAAIVFEFDLGRNFAGDDFFEDSFGHENLRLNPRSAQPQASQKEHLQIGAGSDSGCDQFPQEAEHLLVLAFSLGDWSRSGFARAQKGGAEISDEQGGLAKARELLERLHDLLPGKERRGGFEGARGIPVIKTPLGVAFGQRVKQARCFLNEGLVVAIGRGRIGVCLGFKFAQTESDGRANLFRQVQVTAGERSEPRIDKVETRKVGGALRYVFAHSGLGPGFGFSRLLISCMNSETSRNSL